MVERLDLDGGFATKSFTIISKLLITKFLISNTLSSSKSKVTFAVFQSRIHKFDFFRVLIVDNGKFCNGGLEVRDLIIFSIPFPPSCNLPSLVGFFGLWRRWVSLYPTIYSFYGCVQCIQFQPSKSICINPIEPGSERVFFKNTNELT